MQIERAARGAGQGGIGGLGAGIHDLSAHLSMGANTGIQPKAALRNMDPIAHWHPVVSWQRQQRWYRPERPWGCRSVGMDFCRLTRGTDIVPEGLVRSPPPLRQPADCFRVPAAQRSRAGGDGCRWLLGATTPLPWSKGRRNSYAAPPQHRESFVCRFPHPQHYSRQMR
jgi:hypothetical protein